jgi:molecular chaperone GrpE
MSNEKETKIKKPKKKKECVKCAEHLNGWKRALADYENLKRDLFKEKDLMRKATTEELALSIIPVVDNFEQAVRFKPEGLDDKTESWLQGILYVKTQLDTVLSEMGVEAFGIAGEMFDANLHDITEEKEEEEKEDQSILQILLRGWKLQEKVIRPAKVIINNKK